MLISQMIVKHRGYLEGEDLFHERSIDVDAKAYLLVDKKIQQKQGKKRKKREKPIIPLSVDKPVENNVKSTVSIMTQTEEVSALEPKDRLIDSFNNVVNQMRLLPKILLKR